MHFSLLFSTLKIYKRIETKRSTTKNRLRNGVKWKHCDYRHCSTIINWKMCYLSNFRFSIWKDVTRLCRIHFQQLSINFINVVCHWSVQFTWNGFFGLSRGDRLLLSYRANFRFSRKFIRNMHNIRIVVAMTNAVFAYVHLNFHLYASWFHSLSCFSLSSSRFHMKTMATTQHWET